MTVPNRASSTSTAPASPDTRPRFTRRQEALTIAWLRSLSSRAGTSTSTDTPTKQTKRSERHG